MIDDKKIEAAAIVNSAETFVHPSCSDIRYEGFKAGAKWAINEFLKDLWHSASEEPKEFRKILFTGGSIDTTDTTMLITNNSWSTKVCFKRKGYPTIKVSQDLKITCELSPFIVKQESVSDLQHILFGLGLNSEMEV